MRGVPQNMGCSLLVALGRADTYQNKHVVFRSESGLVSLFQEAWLGWIRKDKKQKAGMTLIAFSINFQCVSNFREILTRNK